MKTMRLILCLITLVGVVAAFGATEQEIAALITQLGDESFPKREAASTELRTIGKPAIPQLKAAENHADPEVRARVAALLQENTPPAENKPGAVRGGMGVVRLQGGNARMQIMQLRAQAVAVQAGAANVESTSENAFEKDGKKYKVTRTEKNGVKNLKVEVTETKDGKEVTRTVEAEDDDALAKKDADLAKVVKDEAGDAQNAVEIQMGGQILDDGQ